MDRSRPASIIDALREEAFSPSSDQATSGRCIGDASSGAAPSTDDGYAPSTVSSILRPPALLASFQSSQPLVPTASDKNISRLTAELVDAIGRSTDEDRDAAFVAGTGTKPSSASTGLVVPQRIVAAAVESDLSGLSAGAAAAARCCLDLREQVRSIGYEIASTERAVNSQKRTREEMVRRREIAEAVVNGGASAAAAAVLAARLLADGTELDLSVIESRMQDTDRVMAQLGRKLEELETVRSKTQASYEAAAMNAREHWRNYKAVTARYDDPFSHSLQPTPSTLSAASLPIPFSVMGSRSGSLLSSVLSQQHCAGGSWCQSISSLRPAGRIPSNLSLKRSRKSTLMQRLSHAITINCHLNYPVFCLKFDKTGRYFLTGADDHLVKLFHVGAGISSARMDKNGLHKFSYGTNMRYPVLVCTLRGHAGVVADIDVSSDNALLATASADGDVRIWGLKDGCPVAILRGHRGGANMVSWSVLTPYRIVTTGEDGLARMWDVREAAMKRYGSVIAKRHDYTLPKIHEDDSSSEDDGNKPTFRAESHSQDFLPPLPVRASDNQDRSGDENDENVEESEAHASDVGASDGGGNLLFVPPLPPGAGGSPIGGLVGPVRNNAAGVINPGAFVAGSEIDEGVRLIAKMQHGEVLPESQMGTRSQRKAVKVICVTRCPIGGHFATGSDDGLGRVWADEDDDRVEQIDDWMTDNRRSSRMKDARRRNTHTRKSGRLRSLRHGPVDASRSALLATLHGHLNSITDMQYSSAGDRIVTASEQDGVVRIWSWGNDSAHTNTDAGSCNSFVKGKFDNIKQILIRLTSPAEGTSNSAAPHRRGGSSTSGRSHGVYCDSARWTSDDARIVTSQCCPANESGSKIVPGTQIVYVWDSRTGQSLLGLPSAHSLSASVLVSHPLDPSILISAGSDGYAHVWDLDTGDKFFSHHNTLTHGMIEPPGDRGSDCAYLDGSISPDGLTCVLTDNKGRVTVFDMLCSEETVRRSHARKESTRAAPAWAAEQYCANDYYEMVYDVHGYCIERGSGQPPHLAPKAVRCNHTGSPFAETVTDAFSCMAGPMPLPEADTRTERNILRRQGTLVRKTAGLLWQNVQGKRTAINVHSSAIRRCGPGSYIANVLKKVGMANDIKGSHANFDPSTNRAAATRSSSQNRSRGSTGSGRRAASSSGRALSNNYQWRDYDDLMHDRPLSDDDAADEDYADAPRGRRLRSNVGTSDESSSEDEDMDTDDDFDDDFGESTRRPSRSGGRNRSSRSQRRNRRDSASREPQQASRASARQSGRSRRIYEEAGSSDEDIVELMSTNNAPSGEHKEDYTVRGHIFRLSDGNQVNRAWVSRVESTSGLSGKKMYAPQVGDSIVYIPKAHYDTIAEFPIGNNSSAPWKLWPKSSAWPVVRCSVINIRYRFPYEVYYKTDPGITSIVAILTLEVTGIPSIATDSSFPWPKPEFIARQTRSSSITFEVSLFESGLADFIVPAHLYTWKIEALQDAIAGRNLRVQGLAYTSYFTPGDGDEGDGSEDADYIPYECELQDMVFSNRERDLHFKNSGYNAFGIIWENGDHGALSSWEGVLSGSMHEVPPPPTLGDDEREDLIGILDKMEEDPLVESWFSHPVDKAKYTDYLNMVELPMDLSIIRTRVELGYYTNVLSVLADFKLIQENCLKYNEAHSDISDAASEMFEKVDEMCRDLKENSASHSIESEQRQQQSTSRSTRRSATASNANNASTMQEGTESRRSSRRSLRSSLEDLPPPERQGPSDEDSEFDSPRTREGGARLRINISSGRMQSGGDGSRRSTRTSSRLAGYETPEDNEHEDREASGSDDNVATGRRTRSAMEPVARSSTRSSPRIRRRRRVSYQEVPSDADELEKNEDSEDSEDSEEEEEVVHDDDVYSEEEIEVSSRPQRSSRSSGSSRSSEPIRASPRSRRKATLLYKEVDSGEELYQDYEEEDDSSDGGRHLQLRRRGSNRETASRGRASSRTSRNARRHIDSSDEDASIDEEFSSEEEEEAASSGSDEHLPTPRSSTKRKKKTSGRASAKKTKGDLYYPQLSKWPPVVDMKDITKVSKKIVGALNELDTDGLFTTPVPEAFPEIADAYLAAIPEPMDFRTIVEERISMYYDMQELQDDLIKVFRNCCTFNGEGTDYYHYAIALWEGLNELFKSVCTEEKILVPRRWS